MKKLRWLLAVLLAVLLSVPAVPAFAGAEEPSVSALIAGMSLEEKAAGLLIPAFRTYNGKNVTSLSAAAKALIRDAGFAGVILFAQNNPSTEGAARLIDEIQTANAVDGRPQLFIAVDQEGGNVCRMAEGMVGPGAMGLGATGDPENARTMGAVFGEELAAMGYNVDFAPDVDVNSEPRNPVIGIRSFSDDPHTVAAMGSAFMQGLQSEGLIPALKHFPGHGDTAVDSHTGLPRIDKTYDELKTSELIPFKQCIDDGAEMIMTAHIQFPAIEKATYTSVKDGSQVALPATLSKTILTDILRRDLGFEGVIVTDSMGMAGVSAHFSRMDAAALALNAGVDLLLMPVDTSSDKLISSLRTYIADLADLIRKGTVPEARVDDALTRILTLKQKHGLLTPYSGADLETRVAAAKATVGSKAHQQTEWDIARRATTLVKNDGMLPIRSGKTLVLAMYDDEPLGPEYAADLLRDDGLLEDGMVIDVEVSSGRTAAELAAIAEGYDSVIAITEVSGSNPVSGSFYKKMDDLADAVHNDGGKIAFVSCTLPYDTARLLKGDAVLAAYSAKGMPQKPNSSDGPVKLYGVAIPAAIYSCFDPGAKFGTLPVNVPALTASLTYGTDVLFARGFGLQYPEPEPDDPTPDDPTPDDPTPDDPTPEEPTGEVCPWDGAVHPNTFIGRLIRFWHRILYAFQKLFTAIKSE